MPIDKNAVFIDAFEKFIADYKARTTEPVVAAPTPTPTPAPTPTPTPTPAPTPTPTPAPTPTPTPTTTRWLGTNLYNLTDWGTDYMFRNFMARARTWHSAPANGWSDNRALALDARRNVLSLASDQNAKSVLFTSPRPTANFVFTWTGNATFSFDGAAVVSSAPNRMVVRFNATGNAVLTMLTCDAANPPKNLQLVLETQASSTSLFNPDFIAQIKNFGCIRFMDLANTNVNRPQAALARDFVTLTEMPIMLTDSETSVPLEAMIELCNTADVNGWFCINVNATDAYVDAYLARIKAKLKPTLKAYVEFSNEHWNTIFPGYNLLPGVGSGTDHDKKMRAYALRAADIGVKTKAVLGTQGISVLGAQSPALYWQQELVNMIRTANKRLPDVITTAPYFGHSLPDDLAVFTDGRINAAVTEAIDEVRASKTQANANGMKLVCYEIGSHSIPGLAINRDPRMEAVYRTYLTGLKAALGGELACQYVLYATPSNSGSWGASEGLYQPDGPKMRALKASI